MIDQSSMMIDMLKELIDTNGPGYLSGEPYQVYKELTKSKGGDRKTAAAILCFLVNGMLKDIEASCEQEELSKRIQKKCGFNKMMSDQLAYIFRNLYSDHNKSEWKTKNHEGLSQFLVQDHTFTWEGFSVWDAGNGTVDCYYNATVVIRPTEVAGRNKNLMKLLKKNPFMTKDAISHFYEKEIRKYLDSEFEEYCTCDDYYEPVVEDFELTYDVTEWCKKNGFEVISCDGDGSNGGYEPKFRRGW